MLAAPFYSLPGTEELAQHFRHIAASTTLPIILYNFPARTGVDMNRQFLEMIADVKAICAIKESSGSFARMLEHIVHFDGRIQRVCGADDQAVDSFLWGARSWIAGASNFLPAEHVALYETCIVKKDFLQGQKLMHTMLPMFYLLENGGKFVDVSKESNACPPDFAARSVCAVDFDGDGLLDLLVGECYFQGGQSRSKLFRNLYEQLKSAKLSKLAA